MPTPRTHDNERAATAEARLIPATEYERVASDPPAGRKLTIMLSRYATYPQASNDAGRTESHYQLDLSDSNAPAVRFVRDPLAEPAEAGVVDRLQTGAQP